MRGDLAMGTIAKWFVLLVLLAIGIGMMVNFSQNTRGFLGDSTKQTCNTTIVQQESFSDSQIKLYLRSCSAMLEARKDKECECYILEGDMSKVNPGNFSGLNLGYRLDSSSFKNSNPIASIKYDPVLKTIFIIN